MLARKTSRWIFASFGIPAVRLQRTKKNPKNPVNGKKIKNKSEVGNERVCFDSAIIFHLSAGVTSLTLSFDWMIWRFFLSVKRVEEFLVSQETRKLCVKGIRE